MKNKLNILRKNLIFLIMVIPGAIWLVLFFYIPVLGNLVAFKDFHHTGEGFIDSLIKSEWVGLDNFKFLFNSSDAATITKNTLGYNLGFITIGLICAVGIAIIFSEMRSKRLVKVYQTAMLLPHFLSWVIIAFFVYSFLSPDKGVINALLKQFNMEPVNWFHAPAFWPFILLFLGVWKGLGYNSIVYYASIMGIDPSYYEAAVMDGATKWQRVRYVTIPQLIPLITILTILAVGNIFRADFGLFYQIPQNSGSLYSVTQVLDTYVYRGISGTGDIGMAAAAGLYQSVVGCVLLVGANFIVRKVDKNSALF
ncbi:sugar ABC transporter permease [Granulicatella sp. WM01]|nr:MULTISPECIES: sugar ABC transporter permease [unclassified Granulicatella]TFU96367.1 sugar ABC transporter permease [Granulicatella sp. WM01]